MAPLPPSNIPINDTLKMSKNTPNFSTDVEIVIKITTRIK